MARREHRGEEPTVVRDLVAAGIGRVDEDAVDAADTLMMDEDAFRAFYDLTARPLWGYLAHITGEPQAADDLLQEAYFRLLKVRCRWESEAHRRNYLYRIATNLARDWKRRGIVRRAASLEDEARRGAEPFAPEAGGPEAHADVRRAFARLAERERALLWLAYAEGSSHQEIADALGLRAKGIRVLLFRARRKLAEMLK
jgi:RNA polymerase sigma-70 factor (ECF subfamily)